MPSIRRKSIVWTSGGWHIVANSDALPARGPPGGQNHHEDRGTVGDRDAWRHELAVQRPVLPAPNGQVGTDAHALDIPDDSFDVVHAHQVLQRVDDPVQALSEMRRVCKPGGLVAVRDSDYRGFTWFPEVPAFDEWMRLPGGCAGQRRRAAGRTSSAVVGAGRRVHRHHTVLEHLVLREPAGPAVLGRDVERPHPAVGFYEPTTGLRDGHSA